MNTGKTVFSQLMHSLPRYEFDKCVRQYQGNKWVNSFTCWNQFLCMSYAQLSHRESLRDLEVSLNSHHQKLYHMGIRNPITRSTLSDANEKRDLRIYQDFAHTLIPIAVKLYRDDPLEEELLAHQRANSKYLDAGIRILELANSAYNQWLLRDSFDKPKLLKILCSNLVLDNKSVIPTYRQPFDLIAKASQIEATKKAAGAEELPPHTFFVKSLFLLRGLLNRYVIFHSGRPLSIFSHFL